jgi:hypothetical protein
MSRHLQNLTSFLVTSGLTVILLLAYQNCGDPSFSRDGDNSITGCGSNNISACSVDTAGLAVFVTNGKGQAIGASGMPNGENTCAGLNATDIANGLHRTINIDINAINFVPDGHYCVRLGPVMDGPGPTPPAVSGYFDCSQNFTLDLNSQSTCTYHINTTKQSVRITCSNLPNTKTINGAHDIDSDYQLELRGHGVSRIGPFWTEPPQRFKFFVNDCN